MARFLLVCAGGAVGTGARYLLGGWAQRALGTAFPWGTLIINALGSLLIVILMHLSIQRGVISPDLRVILTTGIMGGFTTFSALSLDAVLLWERHEYLMAALYVGGSVAGAIAGLALALWVMGKALA